MSRISVMVALASYKMGRNKREDGSSIRNIPACLQWSNCFSYFLPRLVEYRRQDATLLALHALNGDDS